MATEETLVVRRAVLADASDVHGVLLAAFEPLRDLYTLGAFDATVMDPERVTLRIAEGPVWLALSDNTPVGTFGCIDDARGHYLRGMAVVPDARLLGVGKALLAAALRHVENSANQRSWLYTTPFLHVATSLYESAGFVRFDEDPPADLFGTELIRMNLDVS